MSSLTVYSNGCMHLQLASALERAGLPATPLRVDNMVSALDANDDGVIDRDEFEALTGAAAAATASKRRR